MAGATEMDFPWKHESMEEMAIREVSAADFFILRYKIQRMDKYPLFLGFSLVVLYGPSQAQQEIGLQLFSLRNEFETEVRGTLGLGPSHAVTGIPQSLAFLNHLKG